MLVDAHAHLQWDDYKLDFDQVLGRAAQAGVKLIINVGTDLSTSQQSVNQSLQSLHPQIKIYSAIGIHPHDTGQTSPDTINQLEQLYHQHPDQIVAIGECGLDFARQPSDQVKQAQHQLYQTQIGLAKKLDLPLIIHCRDAWEEIFVPDLQNTRGIFHTFTGSADDAQKALEQGYCLSFSCIVTYPKNGSLRQIIKNLPLEKILTETDCPFLPPHQFRGQRNEPAHVLEVVRTIAEIKQLPIEQVEQAIYANAQGSLSLSAV